MTEKHRSILMNTIRSSGVFVTCGLNPPNVMSTHWGGQGAIWNREIFTLPVRKSKLSHDIINSTMSFAVSVPYKDMRNEIIMCDQLSGFSTNKFDELHLHPKKARHIPAYVLGECGLILECKVVYKADMDRDSISDELSEEMYSCKDYHTVYFGEIIEAYEWET